MVATPASALPAQRLMADVLGPSPRRPGTEGSDQANGAGLAVKATAATVKPEVPEAADGAGTPAVDVTLSTQATDARVEAQLPVVYAEVWRDGMKVALIDARGGVKSFNGMVASTQGTGGAGGILLAARRAAEIAASVGGEIRVGGEPIDKQTLSTRAKLSAAYGTGL